MRIRKNDNGITLSLNKDFYNENTVDLAIKDFAKVCKVSKREKNGYHFICFNGLKLEELEEIALEFANHALALMKGV